MNDLRLRNGYRVAVICVALASGAPLARASAQEPPVKVPTLVTPGPDQSDLFDLIRRIRRRTPDPGAPVSPPEPWDYGKPMLTVMPTIGTKPSTGFTFGAASSLAVYFGDPATTQISSAVTGVSFSTKKQTSITAKFTASSAGNQVRFEGDNRFLWTSQDTYGLGTRPDAVLNVNARFTYVRVYETALLQLRRGIYAGLGLHYAVHNNIRPDDEALFPWDRSPFVTYSLENGFALDSQTSGGFGLNVLYDTRDNQINASKGVLASMSFRPYFKDVFGGDSVWQEIVLDARVFKTVTKDGRHKLAAWLYGDFVVDGVAPYFDLPALGTDTYGRTGRGYAEGRFRGERLLYGELEYRGTLTRNGLLGMVAFANTTTVTSLQAGERLFDDFAPAAGAGLRVSFNKRSKTNLCIDYAFGKGGSHGLYLALQEAF